MFRTISIDRAIVVGFWPVGQLMPHREAFNFPSLIGIGLSSRVPDAVLLAAPLRRAGPQKLADTILGGLGPGSAAHR